MRLHPVASRPAQRLALALPVLLALAGGAVAQAPATPPRPSDNWLLDAPDDTARFRALQQQARGFSMSMWEVGERYQRLYDALGDGNAQLAAYQWEKILEALRTGMARRPGRAASADRLFLREVGQPALEAFRSGDRARSWAAFGTVREACMACHREERVGFMNDQALFRQTAAPPTR